MGQRQLGRLAMRVAAMLLPVALAGCASGDESSSPISFTSGSAVQPYPNGYRPEILAFMRTYLNNPAGVHDAVIAEPVQRTVGGRVRYVVCLRYSPRESDGSYRPARERGILFVDGRLDRIIENAAEPCAGVTYAAFPDLGNLSR